MRVGGCMVGGSVYKGVGWDFCGGEGGECGKVCTVMVIFKNIYIFP